MYLVLFSQANLCVLLLWEFIDAFMERTKYIVWILRILRIVSDGKSSEWVMRSIILFTSHYRTC